MSMGAEHQSNRESGEHSLVSALVDSAEAVDATLIRLSDLGVPRDLVEIVVSQAAAERFYGGHARPPRRETFRFAGIGGLVGLVLGAGISLIMVAMPGIDAPGGHGSSAIVQLLGPNLMTVAGAAVGALVGAFRTPRPSQAHARAAESADSILIVVQARTHEEERILADVLAASGGRRIRLEN
jgi:hypothetical protein